MKDIKNNDIPIQNRGVRFKKDRIKKVIAVYDYEGNCVGSFFYWELFKLVEIILHEEINEDEYFL